MVRRGQEIRVTLDIYEAFFQVSPFSKTSIFLCICPVVSPFDSKSRSGGLSCVCVCWGWGGAGGRLIKVLPHFAPCEFNKVGGGGVHLMEGGARNNGPSAKGNWRRGK